MSAAAAAALPVVLRLAPDHFLGPRKTAHYRPHAANSGYYGRAIDGRPIFTFREADRMRLDPQIQFGLRVLRAPLYQLTVTVAADHPRVGRFVRATWQDVWDHTLRRILASTFTYGIAVGETSHRVSRGRVVFDRWDDVHPRDARPLEWARGPWAGQLCGVRVNGSMPTARGATGDDATGGFDLRVPHAFWFAGEAEYGHYWGRPRLADAYEPWLEKRGRHGAVDCRRLWFKKGAFSGGSIRYPLGYTQIQQADGTVVAVNNQDLAREIVEKFEAGGTLALPATKDPTTQEYIWVFEPPKSGGEVGNLIEYPKQLDKEILVALGIPPELVEAATVGSGYSGRAIPAQVFFASCDEIAAMLIDCIDRQIIRPLVLLNFGPRVRWKLKAESLAALVARDPAAAGKMAGQSPEDGPGHAAAGPGGVFSGMTRDGNQRFKMPDGRTPYRRAGGGGVRLSYGATLRILDGLDRLDRRLRLGHADGDWQSAGRSAHGAPRWYSPSRDEYRYGDKPGGERSPAAEPQLGGRPLSFEGSVTDPPVLPADVNVHYGPGAHRLEQQLFGRDPSPELLAAMCNGTDGADLAVTAKEGRLDVSVFHRGTRYLAWRIFDRDGETVVAENSLFETKGTPVAGRGGALVLNQIRALRAAGVSRVTTEATRGPGLDGYEVWPKYGFGGPIPEEAFAKLPADLVARMGESREILDLFELPGGPEAWKKDGASLTLDFDLADGSRNMNVLARYVEGRQDRERQRNRPSAD